jgi:hypothetical protein
MNLSTSRTVHMQTYAYVVAFKYLFSAVHMLHMPCDVTVVPKYTKRGRKKNSQVSPGVMLNINRITNLH